MNRAELRYRGTQVAYAVVCERKLWLFSRGISLEHTSDRVSMGRFVDRTYFEGEEGFQDAYVSIDFIKTGKEIVVHEVKLSRSLEEAHLLQVKYYIYYLKNLGLNVRKGVIHYPKLRKVKEVSFSEEDRKLIEETLSRIKEVLSRDSPPPPVDKPYCRKCAYFEACYG
ncbi:MAG: CRISPR-associated protein Cas4 [Aquificota bacterium]|nr:CRISPR-associated protein Cas4 [Aquificota bacterium]